MFSALNENNLQYVKVRTPDFHHRKTYDKGTPVGLSNLHFMYIALKSTAMRGHLLY